jgi:hypothetical protein
VSLIKIYFQALQSQQEQLQMLKEELAKRDRQIDEAREAAAAANARAAEATTKATEAVNTTAEVKSTETTLNTTVSDLKAGNEILRSTIAKEQAEAKKAEETGPATIKYKGINISPGGFLAAETVFRQRATSGDIPTPMSAIPYPGNALSKVTENNFSGRQCRISFLGDTKVGSAKIVGLLRGRFLCGGHDLQQPDGHPLDPDRTQAGFNSQGKIDHCLKFVWLRFLSRG